MMGLGFVEVLVLALLSGGMNSTDLAALAQPADYFKSRQIVPSIDRMIDIVVVDPKTPKAQIMQLAALRYLADEADAFKKAKNYKNNRSALEDIASGKLANDSSGFAREYAQRVLNKVDGVQPMAVKLPPIREGALAWFPADLRFACALDLRQGPAPSVDPLAGLLKMMPPRVREEMYDQIEKIGNVRVERIAFGMVDSDKREDQKMFIRLTGKGNPVWLAEALKAVSRGSLKSREIKDPAGKPITVLQDGNRAPLILLVGTTDLLLVGYQKSDGKHEVVMQEVLDVRAKKQPHAATGPLKDRLSKIPDKAVAFLVGELPNELQRGFRFILDPVPSKLTAHAERTPMGLDLQAETNLANQDDATKLVQKIGLLRKTGIDELKNAMQQPPRPGFPPVPFQSLVNVLESLQIQSQNERVQGRLFVPDRLVQQMGQLSMMFFGSAPDIAPPPPKK